MPDAFQIRCTKRAESQRPEEQIVAIKGFDDGQHWSIELQEAIKKLESGVWRCFIDKHGQGEWVIPLHLQPASNISNWQRTACFQKVCWLFRIVRDLVQLRT